MLLIIILVLITIIGVVVCACDFKYWDTVVLGFISAMFSSLSGIATFIMIIALIVNLSSAPETQAKYEARYATLLNKVAHIDSFNYAEIASQVENWNMNYRINTLGPANPWVGAFYTIDTSTTNLIELSGGLE